MSKLNKQLAKRYFLGRASTKPGTWNIPEHSGTSRNRASYHKINEKEERKEEKAIKETTKKQTNKQANKI